MHVHIMQIMYEKFVFQDSKCAKYCSMLLTVKTYKQL